MTKEVTLRQADDAQHRYSIAESLNQVIRGKVNTTGTVILTTSSATTVVSNPHAGQDSVPVIVPLDSSAASEAASVYISARSDGSFTITHPNNTTTRQFAFVLLG